MMNNVNIKRTAMMLLLQLAVLIAYSQDKKLSGSFSLIGDLTNYRDVPEHMMVTILKPLGGRDNDSVPVVNNKFRYELTLSEPTLLLFYVKGKRKEGNIQQSGSGEFDYIPVYAIPSDNELIIKDNSMKTAMLKGGTSYMSELYRKLYDEYTVMIQQANSMIATLPVRDNEKIKEIRDSLTDAADETILKPFIKANPTSPVSIKVLSDYSSRPVWQPRKNMAPDDLNDLLDVFPASFKSLPSMQSLSATLKTAKKTLPGKAAMNFSVLDTAGRSVSLSDFKGKTVFIDFWASWCVPCRKENPNVKKLYELYKNRGFVVLSVSLDDADKRGAWLKAIKDDGIEQFVHVSELKGFKSASAQLYDVKAIPTNFIISPEGKFITRNIYGEALATKLSEIFKSNSK